jgi:hypothetical protein
MTGRESLTLKQKPDLFDASRLVSLIGTAGAASRLRVRVHYPNGNTIEGMTKFSDDRIGAGNGPVVVIPISENNSSEGVIPLGGQTSYAAPPRMSSMDSGRRPLFGKVEARKMPNHEMSKDLQFELIEQ